LPQRQVTAIRALVYRGMSGLSRRDLRSPAGDWFRLAHRIGPTLHPTPATVESYR